MQIRNSRCRVILPVLVAGLSVAVLAGCGGGSSPTADTGGRSPTATSATGAAVLPVPTNPISNTATAPGLTIARALVENNVDPATGKAVGDHLEVALKNTSGSPLTDLEIYYRVTDPAKNVAEGYYSRLAGISIAPGQARTIHFDNTTGPDHFPVNRYGLFYSDKNALVVDVTASAPGVKPATFTVRKDAGGAEAGVE